MYRRTLLATLGCMTLAGCSAGNGNGNGDEAEETGTDGDVSESEHIETFSAYLETNAIETVHLEQDGALIALAYVPRGQTDEELATEIGIISGGFYRGVEEGLEADRLEATMRSPDDETLADWYAEVDWLEAYRAGELSDNDLSLRVLETLEVR